MAAHASKVLMFCASRAWGRKYLNSRYNSVSEFDMVVPERKVAPKSFPVRSCIVRMAKSIFKARWLPSLLPSPATLSWRVLNIRFLNVCDSSTKRWSIPIVLKSTISSLRFSILNLISSSFACKFICRLTSPFSIAREMLRPC